MKRINILLAAVFLMALNVFAWQEVFVLTAPRLLKVDFLSVGQGDSEFIETPQGHQILIDGGPDSTVLGKLNSLLPFWDKTIDVVILTHPEKDHMAGILDVLQRYKVNYFLWTGVVKTDAENKQLAALLKEVSTARSPLLAKLSKTQPTKVLTVNAGEQIGAGDVLIDILFPFEDLAGKEIKNTSNDTCLVARLTYGKDSFLFTGDIDSAAEKEIAEKENIASDVLKIAHHGSKYSTSDLFLEAVKPKIAVIEVGKNSYGHPTTEVLNRLEKFGIQIKRTDKDGDVKLLSDGNKIKLEN
ncbi:MAG: MBL fold metallo-hydrolase, partial [Candidatus Staskawiczbacteria bacterium]|nr:MBL fold metallo-hydrolase [Candidatus Staskawiczbacteria bacterium]